MDPIDKKLLALLQEDATISIAELAGRVNLSNTPCWRRIQKLENQGVIKRRVAVLDREKLNLGLVAIVSIKTSHHSQKWLDRFVREISNVPEVVDFYRMAGDTDYLLRVVVPDIKAYDAVYKRLIKGIDIFDVSSAFVMEEVKSTTALPLTYAS